MWRQIIKTSPSFRSISTTSAQLHRVAIIGAAGGIGQALAMLMKANPLVSDLTLYDRKNVAGIGADVSHIDTFSGVQTVSGEGRMAEALECAELVICAAGVAPKSGETYENLFKPNAEIISEVAVNVAKVCPTAFLAIITSPINSVLPLAAELLKKRQVYDARKLFGVNKLDVTRTRTFIGDHLIIDPNKVQCEVIGGRSDTTFVPILSQATPCLKADAEDLAVIYRRIRECDEAVIKAKGGQGASQLCIAHATGRFCHGLLRALSNEAGVEETAFVESQVHPEVPYFASHIVIGVEGVKKFEKLPELSKYEKSLLAKSVQELKENIAMGVAYAKKVKD